MASAAERTNMILGTAVTAPILRYHPAIVAQAFATLDYLYPKRIFLGLGAGEALNESPLGYSWPLPGQRVEMLEETTLIIRRLWSEDFLTFKGKYYELKKANLYTKPKNPIRIYIAAGGPRVARLAGRLADGLLVVDDLKQSSKLAEVYEKSARKSGRDTSSLEKIVELLVSYDEDYDKALKSCRVWAGIWAGFKYDLSDPREIEEYGNQTPDEYLEKRWIISNSAEEHIRCIKKYVEAGFNHIYFVSSSPDESNFIKFYGKKVLPYLTDN
jgi:coenzyme F420-dependent glucose-6-phosphate dehydrogenase